MNLISFDKNKGVIMLKIGGMLYGIYLMILIIFAIVNTIHELPIDLLNLTKFTLFGYSYTIPQLWWILLIIYAVKVLDGFIEGFINSLLNFVILAIFYTIILNWGKFALVFEYQSLSVNISIDFTYIFWILGGLYVWVLFCEVWVLGIKSHAVARFGFSINVLILKLFKKSTPSPPIFVDTPEIPIIRTQEKVIKSKWIDSTSESILFEEDEAPLTANWIEFKGESRKNWFQFLVLDTISMIFYGFLFALTTYLISEQGGPYYNNTVEAFFFPTWFVLLAAYKSPAHYFRAYVYLFFSLVVQLIIFQRGLITVDAFFLLNFIIPISKWFLFDLSGIFAALSPSEVLEFVGNIMVIYMNIMFGIMVVYLIFQQFRSKKQLDLLVSTKHLFIRRKWVYNQYDLIIDILYAWIWPFNLSTYREILQELRYGLRTRQESLSLEYGRLSFQNAIRKITKQSHQNWKFLSQAIILLVVGSFTFQYQIGIPLLIWGFRQLWFLFKHKGIDIRIDFYWRYAEGSAFILSSENIFHLYEVDEDTAALIPTLQSYPRGIIRKKKGK